MCLMVQVIEHGDTAKRLTAIDSAHTSVTQELSRIQATLTATQAAKVRHHRWKSTCSVQIAIGLRVIASPVSVMENIRATFCGNIPRMNIE